MEKLKRSVEGLRLQAGNTNVRNVPKVPARDGLARKVTDSKGNVFDTFIVDMTKTPVKIYHEDDGGNRIASFQQLREYLEKHGEEVVFATNGGMYTPQGTPVGLLIENGQEKAPLDLRNGGPDANFYLKPNGVFAMTNKEAVVMESSKFGIWTEREKVTYATQSGPMLIIDGKVHPKFKSDSPNLTIRSGVGVLNNTQIVFAISEKDVNFYDFAMLFLQQFKCKNALYFDGFVSRMYLPTLDRHDLEGDFGSIIAVSK